MNATEKTIAENQAAISPGHQALCDSCNRLSVIQDAGMCGECLEAAALRCRGCEATSAESWHELTATTALCSECHKIATDDQLQEGLK